MLAAALWQLEQSGAVPDRGQVQAAQLASAWPFSKVQARQVHAFSSWSTPSPVGGAILITVANDGLLLDIEGVKGVSVQSIGGANPSTVVSEGFEPEETGSMGDGGAMFSTEVRDGGVVFAFNPVP